MDVQTITTDGANYPERCRQMHKKPKSLYYAGEDLSTLLAKKRVAIVGTRKISPYGRQVTADFSRQLAEQGVTIVSGLAYGVDSAAHQACLNAGGKTIAVLPSPIDNIAPSAHHRLAQRISQQGGLLSQYPSGSEMHKGNFIERNELVAAVSDVVLVIEAGEHSGTRHTVEFALELSVPVLVVPGNITSSTSMGTNNFIKSGQCQVATCIEDVLEVLGISRQQKRIIKAANQHEQCLLDLMEQGISDGVQLMQRSGLRAEQFASTLTMLEITAKVRPLGANHWVIA